MDQLCMKINTDIHGSLVGKQNLKIHKRHPMLRKILVVIKKKMMHHAIILADLILVCDIISQ